MLSRQDRHTSGTWHFGRGELQALPEVAFEIRPEPCGTGPLLHEALCIRQNLVKLREAHFLQICFSPKSFLHCLNTSSFLPYFALGYYILLDPEVLPCTLAFVWESTLFLQLYCLFIKCRNSAT